MDRVAAAMYAFPADDERRSSSRAADVRPSESLIVLSAGFIANGEVLTDDQIIFRNEFEIDLN